MSIINDNIKNCERQRKHEHQWEVIVQVTSPFLPQNDKLGPTCAENPSHSAFTSDSAGIQRQLISLLVIVYNP